MSHVVETPVGMVVGTVSVTFAVGVTVTVGVAVAVSFAVGVTVTVGVTVAVSFAVGVGVGVAVARLSQSRLSRSTPSNARVTTCRPAGTVSGADAANSW